MPSWGLLKIAIAGAKPAWQERIAARGHELHAVVEPLDQQLEERTEGDIINLTMCEGDHEGAHPNKYLEVKKGERVFGLNRVCQSMIEDLC